MNIINISAKVSQLKSAQTEERKKMQGRNLNAFVDQLIRENAIHKGDYYSLFVCDLDNYDKRLFLSYLIGPELFEDFTANQIREKEAIKEYEEEMQYFINEKIDEVYIEDMRECHDGLDECLNQQQAMSFI